MTIEEILPEHDEDDGTLRDPLSRESAERRRLKEIFYGLQQMYQRLFPARRPGSDDEEVTRPDKSQADQTKP